MDGQGAVTDTAGMVRIPGGTFRMGSDRHYPEEAPAHRVTVDPFWKGFVDYCRLCGWALALAHAKSGDPAMIAGYCGTSAALDEAIAAFALAYAKQTEQDHAALKFAERSGRIEVASDKAAI
jgi:hypothetical protein